MKKSFLLALGIGILLNCQVFTAGVYADGSSGEILAQLTQRQQAEKSKKAAAAVKAKQNAKAEADKKAAQPKAEADKKAAQPKAEADKKAAQTKAAADKKAAAKPKTETGKKTEAKAADKKADPKKTDAKAAAQKAAAKKADAASKAAPAQKSAAKAAPVDPKKLKPRTTAQQRKVELHGARNTRELGGLPTADGYFIKEKKLYRSGALCYINANSAETLKERGIASVVELRTPQEISREGKDLPAFTASLRKVYNCPMVNTAENGGPAYLSYIKAHNFKSIAQFFSVLADEKNYPVLFHCSAGKDRTGIMAALVLELAGVPRPIIMDDYLQSQRNSAGLKVDADWLRGVFKTIDKEGGIVAFLSNRGVKKEDMQKIRAILRTK